MGTGILLHGAEKRKKKRKKRNNTSKNVLFADDTMILAMSDEREKTEETNKRITELFEKTNDAKKHHIWIIRSRRNSFFRGMAWRNRRPKKKNKESNGGTVPSEKATTKHTIDKEDASQDSESERNERASKNRGKTLPVHMEFKKQTSLEGNAGRTQKSLERQKGA